MFLTQALHLLPSSLLFAPVKGLLCAMAREHQPKWEGKASAEVSGAKAEQIWTFLDFFSLNKWFPTPICLPVEGISGQPGCVRYCAGFKTPVDDKNNKETLNWTKQKLLSINPNELTFTYRIVDSNVGFHGYISTWRVLPKEDGCIVEWKYEVEPPEGWTLGELDSFISKGLQVMAKRMEKAVQA